jgi:uncharacterized protein (TIRG00374 family)
MEKEPKALRLPTMQTILRRLVPIVCIGVLFNLGLTWYLTDQSQPLDWSKFSPGYLVLAAMLSLIPWLWHGLRLLIWSQFFGVPVSNLDLLRIAVVTDVGGVVAPNVVGGTPFKMGMLIQHGYRPGQAASLALLGQFEEGIFYIFVIIPVCLSVTRPWSNPLWQKTGSFLSAHGWMIALIAALLALVILALQLLRRRQAKKNGRPSRSEQWQMLISDFRHTSRLIYVKGRKPFLYSMLALAGQWATRFFVLIAVLLAMGLQVDFFNIFFLQWMVFIASVFVPTPGGAGGAEAAFILVFGALIPRFAVGPVMTGWRFLTYYFILLVGVAILLGTRKRAESVS